MHILFLTDNFPPEVNAPASRTFEHCREWIRAGHRVTVITCVPNFPRGVVYPGYRNRLWQSETMDGIRVVRVWSYISANEGFVRRVLDYVSYMMAAVIAAPFVRKVDIVIGTSPHFFTACAAYVTSFLKRTPFVFELRDLWPASIKEVGAMREGFWLRAMERLELFLYRKAARIVALTQAFKSDLVRRGIDAGKIDVVTNGVDLSRFSPRPKDAALAERYGLTGKFVAGYIGTHGMAHALETLLDAASRLRAQEGGQRIRIVFLGDGARKSQLMKQASGMGLDNVIFIDSVPKQEVAAHWSLLDVSIIHLRKSELFTTVIPSKLFESMGMGIPVLHGVAGESADIVKHDGVGLAFEPEDPEALGQSLLRLADDRIALDEYRARCVFVAPKYDRKALAARMLDVLEEIAPAR